MVCALVAGFLHVATKNNTENCSFPSKSGATRHCKCLQNAAAIFLIVCRNVCSHILLGRNNKQVLFAGEFLNLKMR